MAWFVAVVHSHEVHGSASTYMWCCCCMIALSGTAGTSPSKIPLLGECQKSIYIVCASIHTSCEDHQSIHV